MSSSKLFRQLGALREAAGVSEFSIKRRFDFRQAEKGAPAQVKDLVTYAKLVGAEVVIQSADDNSAKKAADAVQKANKDLDKANEMVKKLRKELKGLKDGLKEAKKPAKKATKKTSTSKKTKK
jgi:predicted xylose isomerase-like sugar epimerase